MITPETITAWEQEDNLLFVELPFGLYEFRKNNEIRRLFVSYCSPPSIIEPGTEIFRVNTKKEIIGYLRKGVPETYMSVEEHERLCKSLLVGSWNTDDGLRFPSPEAEELWNTLHITWKARYKDVEECLEISVQTIPCLPSINEFIMPCRKILGDPKNTLFGYERAAHIRDYFRQEFPKSDLQFDESRLIEFAKLNGKYITIIMPELGCWKHCSSAPFVGDRTTVIETYNKTQATLKKAIRSYKLKRDEKAISERTAGAIASNLHGLKRYLECDFRTLKDYKARLVGARRQINQILERLEQEQ